MDLKVGQTVTIRKDLANFKGDGEGCSINIGMHKYAGMEAVITGTVQPHYFLINIDHNDWSWTAFMFEESQNELSPWI